MGRTILNYEQIVIGSSLEALMFAFIRELPVFFSVAERPFRFDYLDPEVDLAALRLQNESRSLKTFGEDRIVGLPKELLWERLMFLLSLQGKTPLANLCASMRYTGEALICSDEYAKIAEIKFQQAYYFGDRNCYKLLDQSRVDNGKYICYDWISFNRGGKHEIDFIETDDAFVKHIWFYPSDRIDGNSPVKDACVVSYLTEEEVFDFDFSDAARAAANKAIRENFRQADRPENAIQANLKIFSKSADINCRDAYFALRCSGSVSIDASLTLTSQMGKRRQTQLATTRRKAKAWYARFWQMKQK